MKITRTNLPILILICTLLLCAIPGHAQFQRQFGTALDESFSKVIQSGTNYYVLGIGETTDGLPGRATVTRLNASGQLQWTLSMNTASQWNDAVLTPSGNLLVVGHSLPNDNTSGGIMGLVTAAGAFTWVRSYNIPGNDGFTRIVQNPVPQNAAFPYYVLGFQTEIGASTAELVLLNLNESGTFNWKKQYNWFLPDDKFARDLEALPNGDLLLAGNFGTLGVIIRTDNTGQVVNGVSRDLPFAFIDVAQGSGGTFYAIGSNLQNGQVHLMKFDNDLIGQWDITIGGLESATQVWQAPNGGIYVTGVNPAPPLLFQTAVYRFADNMGEPVLSWVKYLDNGEVAYEGGTTSLLTSGQIAFADGRTPASGGFGQLCAFISVSDSDLSTCMTVDINEVIQNQNTILSSPVPPDIDFYDVPTATALMGTLRTWQQANACNVVPCVANFNFQFSNCNTTVSFANTSTGPAPLTYSWNFGYTAGGTSIAVNPIHTYPAQCGTYNVCLTVTGNGCSNTICKNVTLKYPQQPVLTCPPNITVRCNTDLSPAVTGFATLTGACSGVAPNLTYSDATSGTMPCNGTVLRTWSAVDECGTTRTCVQTILVQDNVAPVALCQPGFGLELDPDCTVTLTPAMIDAGSTDNCQIQSMSISPTVLTGCGEFMVTLTVTDLCNNVRSCTTGIQTIEIEPPVIVCPPNVQKDCDTGLTPDITGFATATDNCLPAPVIAYTDLTLGTLPCDGVIQRTWTATDNCGNEATCVQNIVVIDNVPPMIACPQDLTVNTNPGQCFFSGVITEPTATDNCNPNPAITCYLVTAAGLVFITPGMEFPKGTHTICCVADDGCVDVSELICGYPCTANGDVQIPESSLGFAQNSSNNSPEQLLAVLGVQPGVSGNTLVRDVLVGGNCFDISNVTTTGQASQFSTFSNGLTNIGIDAGVILTTGPGTLAIGPNNSNNAGSGVGGVTADAHLSTLTTGTLYDRASLEFDFIPTQSLVTFRFVFASEEYCEKAGNALSDVFGFFISGPGISGQQNIALIPLTTTPIGINTVNHLTNNGLYVNNQPATSGNLCGQTPSTAAATTELQYDGFTQRFTAVANVQPGQTYHLKLAIADVGDDLHDSAIFLDAGSFDAGGNASVEWVVNSNPVSTVAYENCGMVNLVFDRVGISINAPVTVAYTISGSATAGLDYAPFASSIVIPAGQGQFTLPVTLLNDAILEGDETIIITLNDVCSFLMPQKTLTIKDASLLQAKCTFTLTVEDHELPVIMCAPNVLVPGLPDGAGSCTKVVGTIAPTTSDNCPMLMVDYVITGAITATGINNASGTTFLEGTSTVTYTATDMNGNMSTCQTQVTVVCDYGSVCDCPEGSFQGPNLVGNGDFSAGNTGFTSDYNYIPFPAPGPGNYTVFPSFQNNFWNCTDHTTGSPTGNFLVVDGSLTPGKAAWRQNVNIAPSVEYMFCAYVNNLYFPPNSNQPFPDVQVWLVDGNNSAILLTSAVVPESPDLWIKIDALWSAPAVVANPYRLEIRDGSILQGGNDFAVDDISFKTCSPPPPCEASFTVNFVDNCGHVQLVSTSTGQQPISYLWSTSQSTPNIDLILPCGPHTFSVSITCADGSMSSATQTINITDNTPPTIVCPQDVQLTCFSPTTPSTTGFATATDNCSILSLTFTDVITGTQPCNQVIIRTWKAEDWCNNIATCVQTITVMDNIPPVLTNCPQNITAAGTLDPNGVCSANIQVASPTATDLCDQSVSLVNSFNETANASGTYPDGTTTVTWTATDDCGNTKTCAFEVTVDCSTTVCCPEFSLLQLNSITPCPGVNACMSDPVAFHTPTVPTPRKTIACKNSVHSYYVIPNLPGFTYNWSITGGTLTSVQGNNPGVITWGGGSMGSLQVIITDPSGTCRDTITHEFCLIDSPTAGFTVAPIPGTTVCTNQSVTFTNTSVGANT
ncbi:MAG: choice-of-anchor L domain-containing protein, partial [Saprospiraceae bacterium]|nr:choice-of-anchor L domain-containing protein [Saprospiraceae bacterium]